MGERLRFHLDEHADPRVAKGLQQRRIDVTTTNEVQLRTTDDDAQVAYVRRTQRVLVTCDAGFVARHRVGMVHPGIVFYHANSRSIGEVIAFLALLAEVITPEEMRDRVEYA